MPLRFDQMVMMVRPDGWADTQRPIEHTLIGGVGAMKAATSKAWLVRLGRLGQAAV
ncbi:MAG TPA: hypothetical protein VFY73_09095 [Ideonella sp.]|uniref:hypothetical protein n=1 Tax=Ideonella sp. TaxID=1929293 RepID=UPI002E3038E4|nr:hypothetical protein [Ideonella sp.]HEX5684179.1 hypothetical protein [Ideonella sp.]